MWFLPGRGGGLTSTGDKRLEVVPGPVVKLVAFQSALWLLVGAGRTSGEQEVRLPFSPSDGDFCRDPRCRVGVVTADYGHLRDLADALSDLLLPVALERFLHGPISDLE